MAERVTPLLRVNDLRIGFDLPEGQLIAVDGVSFQIHKGSTVALVGESGSGKSVVSQAIMGLLPRPAKILGGSILFADPKEKGTITDIARLAPNGSQMRSIRGGRISIIFQEPMTALNPVRTIGSQVAETLIIHQGMSRADAAEIAAAKLDRVGLAAGRVGLDRYPHELSGGQRQRVALARALARRPKLLLLDEWLAGLNPTELQEGIDLIRSLREEGITIILVEHVMDAIRSLCDRCIVMAAGSKIAEGSPGEVLADPEVVKVYIGEDV